jgi:hypothetical protein
VDDVRKYTVHSKARCAPSLYYQYSVFENVQCAPFSHAHTGSQDPAIGHCHPSAAQAPRKSDKIKRGEATKAETKEYAKLNAERAKEVKAQRREKSSRRASSTVKSQ